MKKTIKLTRFLIIFISLFIITFSFCSLDTKALESENNKTNENSFLDFLSYTNLSMNVKSSTIIIGNTEMILDENEKLSTKELSIKIEGTNIILTDEDYECLCKIIQAEAGGEDLKGKVLVGNVIINRVLDGYWGDSIKEVVFAKGQFSPVKNGSYDKAKPSEQTIEAVELIIEGVDYSQGALYFRTKSGDFTKLTKMFIHGNHAFYK